MKKTIFPICFLLLTNIFLLFANKPVDGYLGIPTSDQLLIYEKPGFFNSNTRNYSTNENDRIKITAVSEYQYKKDNQISSFYEIETSIGEKGWIYGGDLIVVSSKKEGVQPWYKVDYNTNLYLMFDGDDYFFEFNEKKQMSFDHFAEEQHMVDLFKHNYSITNTYRNETWNYKLFWSLENGTFQLESFREDRKNDIRNKRIIENYNFLPCNRVLNIKDEEFWSYFENDDFESLIALKESGFNKFDNPYLFENESPLVQSINERNFDMISFLIENGYSQTYSGGDDGCTISAILNPIENNDLEMVKFLLTHGFIKNIARSTSSIDYDLFRAILSNKPEMVCLLIDLGYDVNEYLISYSNGGVSASANSYLNKALERNRFEIFSLLLEKGANPNQLIFEYKPGFVTGDFESYTVLDVVEKKDLIELINSYSGISVHNFSNNNFKDVMIGLSGTINDSRVRARTDPSLHGTPVGYFERDEQVFVVYTTNESMQIGELNATWYLVQRKNGELVWVYGYYVNIDKKFLTHSNGSQY